MGYERFNTVTPVGYERFNTVTPVGGRGVPWCIPVGGRGVPWCVYPWVGEVYLVYMPGWVGELVHLPGYPLYLHTLGIPASHHRWVHERQRGADGYVRADGALGSDL